MNKGVFSGAKLAWALVATLFAACLALGYLWIDRSITLSYVEASIRNTGEARDQATMLLAHEWKELRTDDVYARLQKIKEQTKDAETLLKRESTEGVIYFGNLRFKFENDRLAEVK